MPTNPQIVIAFDFSDTSEIALQHILTLATEDARREFHVLAVLDPDTGIGLKKREKVTFQYTEEVQEIIKDRIQSMVGTVDKGKDIRIWIHVRIGDAVTQILALAAEVGANLLVVGSHGNTGVKRLLLGSVSETIVREAGCPVLVCRERRYTDVNRSEIIEVEKSTDVYVAPHRYEHKSGFPVRSKAWALY